MKHHMDRERKYSTKSLLVKNTNKGGSYDAIGNLVADHEKGVQIEWTPYGKVRKVTAANGNTLAFRYDAAGNRVEKKSTVSGGSVIIITRYVRDASGNVMSEYLGGTTPHQQPIYGSSRLGLYKGQRTEGVRTLGAKQYELTNHLGNVLTVVKDNIHLQGTDTWAHVEFAMDYYAFGGEMPGRKNTTKHYRYGFNGKEKDTESQWGDTSYDYGFRIYNPRYARFLSVDPLTKSYPWYTPYQFAGNKPIWAIDVDGLEEAIIIKSKWYEQGIKTALQKEDYNEAYRLASKALNDPAKNIYAENLYKDNYAARWTYNGFYPTGISFVGINGDILYTKPIEPFIDHSKPEYEIDFRIGIGPTHSFKSSLFGFGAGKEFSLTKTLFNWNYKSYAQSTEVQEERFNINSPWNLQLGVHKGGFGANFSADFDKDGIISRDYNFKTGPINTTFNGLSKELSDHFDILDISTGSGLIKLDLNIKSGTPRFTPYIDKTKHAADALRYVLPLKVIDN
jgi:RHS repeat-associated protein